MTQPKVQKSIPISGQTVQIQNSDNDITLSIEPASSLAALTVSFPSIPHPGMNAVVTTTRDITVLSMSGGTFDKQIGTMKANDTYVYTYNDISATWIQSAYSSDATAIANTPRLWLAGVRKSLVKEVATSAVVSGGAVSFSLADSSNAAIFANVYKESANFWIEDTANQYQFGGYTLSADRKTLTVTVTRIALNLGVIVFTAAANGKVVYLTIKGD